VDKIHKSLAKTLSARIVEVGEETKSLVHIIFISRSLQLSAELAVNFAEDVVFKMSSKDIRHI